MNDYRKLRERGDYFADHTLLIRDLIDMGFAGQTIAFLRPDGFGKTLMLSMIRSFLEGETDLFAYTKIMEEDERYLTYNESIL